jgi:hypothetical protein
MRRFVAFGLVFFTVLAVVFGSVSPTEAVVIIVDITARVVSVIDLEDFLDGAVVPGDTITGRYIFDTTVSDRNDAFIAAEYVYLGFPYGIDLTVVGCCRFRTDPDNTAFTIEIVNREPGAGQDAFLMNSELGKSSPSPHYLSCPYWLNMTSKSWQLRVKKLLLATGSQLARRLPRPRFLSTRWTYFWASLEAKCLLILQGGASA